MKKGHFNPRLVSILLVSILKEVSMSQIRWIPASGVGIMAAACWIVTGTLQVSAAPQLVIDAAGVTVDTGPALWHRAPVSYPSSARQKGVQGTVTLEARTDAEGNVTDARVLSGPDELRRAALQSVLQWHFQRGASGATRAISITFRLPDPASPSAPAAESTADQPKPSPEELIRELRAKATELDLRRAAASGSPIKGISVLGLPDQKRDELLARLPVHAGETFTADALLRVTQTIREFDEHLGISARTDTGELWLTIATPGSPMLPAEGSGNGPKLVRSVPPVYPPEAKAARLSGIVKLSATIGTDGAVKRLEVISGHPLLVPAAMEAVRQWVYQPTLWNGNPVEWKTEISVNFRLAD